MRNPLTTHRTSDRLSFPVFFRARMPRIALVLAAFFFLLPGCGFLSTGQMDFGKDLSDGVFGGATHRPTAVKSAIAAPGRPLLLAAAAHAAGSMGTNWRTDIAISNPDDETATYRLVLLRHGADNTNAAEREVSLGAGSSVRLDDVLAEQFGFSGSAAVLLVPTTGRAALTSRTYNLLGESNELGLPAGSTFGQFVPAVDVSQAIRFGEQGRLIQLSHTRSGEGGFRTNIGIVNMATEHTDVEIDLHLAAGNLLGTVSLRLDPLGYRQLNRVFEQVTAEDVDDGFAVVRTTTAEGAFVAYASVVDNLTGDPIAILAPRLLPTASSSSDEAITIVATANVAGAFGTNWRTDLELHNPGDEPVDYTIEMLRLGADNSAPESRSYTLEAGRSARFENVLGTIFGLEGQAALKIVPETGRLIATSRTYNLLGEGNELGLPAGASFGQYIPGLTPREAIRAGEQARLIQLSHRPDGTEGFRTNLILVNASALAIDVEVEMFEADGTHLGTATRSLAPFEYNQINRVFQQVTNQPVGNGYLVVRTTTEGGSFFTLASVVDNLTGDPVGIGPAVVVPAEIDAVLGEVDTLINTLERTEIESFVDQLQAVGLDTFLDLVAADASDVAQRTVSGLTFDYGDGWTTTYGTVWSGIETFDASGLSIEDGSITGSVRCV